LAATRQGKNYTWQLSDLPFGSGDAGEVYAVICHEKPDLQGMLKTPARIATGGTIQRQALQIEQESLALSQLDGLPQGKAHPPRLLDEAPKFTQGTANYFIVSETALGKDLASMLTESRKSGKPFPRRVIITILDALFDLFSRAHRAGVLWNDVKLDHIYWHNLTGSITVIDWGNALFLNHQGSGNQPITPRWEDYQQMVETLGDFLQSNAPELFTDLGWDEFQGRELDSTQVSVLARRIAYQQQVVSLKEMENLSLIRVILNQEPSIAGLEKITTYHQILEELGAPCPHQEIVHFAQSLVLSSLEENNIQTSVQATALIWNMYHDDLNLPWYLARAYFRDPDLLANPKLADLIKSTFLQDYSASLWTLAEIAQGKTEPSWWSQLVPVLRQTALGSPSEPPLQLCTTLHYWLQKKEPQNTGLIAKLSAIIKEWRAKGENLQNNPFEYDLLEIIQGEDHLPQKSILALKQSFALGEKAIRRLFQSWVDMNWDEMPKAFQQVISWDPDRWGIVSLYERVDAFTDWLEILQSGPQFWEKPAIFLQQMMASRPAVEQVLRRPPWFHSLLTSLTAVNAGEPIANFREDLTIWAPWLLEFANIHEGDDLALPENEAEINQACQLFINHLKAWSDFEASLQTLKEHAPRIYLESSRLVAEFKNSLSFMPDPEEKSLRTDIGSHPELKEGWDVLGALKEWRFALQAGNISEAVRILSDQNRDDWQILNAALEKTVHWQSTTLPYLQAIHSFSGLSAAQEPSTQPDELFSITDSIAEIQKVWCQIYDAGASSEILEILEQSVEHARKGLFSWRQAFEHSENRISQILYQSHLKLIREITDRLLLLWQHVQQASSRMIMLEKANDLRVNPRMTTIENITDHLGSVESLLICDEKARKYPSWQDVVSQLQSTSDPEERRQIVLVTPQDHPLVAFLIQSQFGYD